MDGLGITPVRPLGLGVCTLTEEILKGRNPKFILLDVQWFEVE